MHSVLQFCRHVFVVVIARSVCSLCAANGESLVVDYNVLAQVQQVIAFFLPEAPTEMLKIFDEVCTVCFVCGLFWTCAC